MSSVASIPVTTWSIDRVPDCLECKTRMRIRVQGDRPGYCVACDTTDRLRVALCRWGLGIGRETKVTEQG